MKHRIIIIMVILLVVLIPSLVIHKISNDREYEIYTRDDIYYVTHNRVKSEMGLDTFFRNQKILSQWLAQRTAEESLMTNWEVNQLLTNYLTVNKYSDGAVGVSIVNPYHSPDTAMFEIMNHLEIDTFNHVRYYYYYED